MKKHHLPILPLNTPPRMKSAILTPRADAGTIRAFFAKTRSMLALLIGTSHGVGARSGLKAGFALVAGLGLCTAIVPHAKAAPSIRDVRDTVRAIPVDLDHNGHVPIKRGEILQLLKLYHDNGNAWSWNEYIAYEPCPNGYGTCAVPFVDGKGNAYSLKDNQHAGEDALSTIGFYNVQSAQGRWNLFMIRMERILGDSTYARSPTTAHVSLFKLAPHDSEVPMPENNFFEEIATIPVGDYCNSNIAMTNFLNQPLPANSAPDGCMQQ